MPGKLVANVGVIGLGLIGGSFARSLKVNNAVDVVLGFDLRVAEMATAVRLGVVDIACKDIAGLVAQSDIVVLATPVMAIEPVLREMAPHLNEHHIISDMASVKGAVVDTVKRVFGKMLPRFVPGHPIAGSEKSGVAAANPELFKDHKTILTPLSETSADALDMVAKLWRVTGARVLMMAPTHHDEVLAATSHLPHLIAFSLVDTLAGSSDNKDIFRYAAGGFRDFTRIAASDPVMWHDIYLSNRVAVLKAVDDFSEDLGKLRHAIETGDGEKLLGVFTRAKAAREHFGRMLAGKSYTAGDLPQQTAVNVEHGSPLRGDIRLSGDKSISHRVVVLGALARGITRLEGFPESESSLATIQAFRDMGVVIEGPDRGHLVIHGVGLHGLQPPPGPLYVGHSATSMRLLAGVMSGQRFATEIIGDHITGEHRLGDHRFSEHRFSEHRFSEHRFSEHSFSDHSSDHKPMLTIVALLNLLGAEIEVGDNGLPPLVVKGKRKLVGKQFRLQEINAEVKAALLLAAVYAEGKTTIIESYKTRDHSERLLAGFGYPVEAERGCLAIPGRGELIAKSMDIPVDFTLALYFMVAASITPGSDLILRHVGLNPSRALALAILQRMGASIEITNERAELSEKVADVRICSAVLTGFELSMEECLQASEELPALLVAAAFASSTSRIKGYSLLPAAAQNALQTSVSPILASGGVIDVQRGDLVTGPCSRVNMQEVLVQSDHPGSALAAIVMANGLDSVTTIANCGGLLNTYPQVLALANEIGFRTKLV